MSKKLVELLRENLELKGMSPAQLQEALGLIDEELNRAKSAEERSPSTERRGAAPSSGVPRVQTGHGPTPQPNLAIVTEVHELDEADKVCPSCGLQLALWEGQDDETEEVDVVERCFVMKKHMRRKYRCRCGCVEMSDMPSRLVPGGRYSNNFAIEVAASKFIQHLPFERQVRTMKGEGLIVENQTLWDQVSALANKLEPAWKSLAADAIAGEVLGFDETRWQMLIKGPPRRKAGRCGSCPPNASSTSRSRLTGTRSRARHSSRASKTYVTASRVDRKLFEGCVRTRSFSKAQRWYSFSELPGSDRGRALRRIGR